MIKEIKIRKAALKDIDCISELLIQVNNVHHEGRPDLFLVDKTKYSKEELLRRAAGEGIVLRGLSFYCQTQPARPSTLVAGYGGLRDECIPEAAERLKRAWK